MASKAQAVQKYKALMKQNLDPSERKQLQQVLSHFVQEKSFQNLRVGLTNVLNTQAKRDNMGGAIRDLIPDNFHQEFDMMMLTLPPVGTKLDSIAAKPATDPSQKPVYQNWGWDEDDIDDHPVEPPLPVKKTTSRPTSGTAASHVSYPLSTAAVGIEPKVPEPIALAKSPPNLAPKLLREKSVTPGVDKWIPESYMTGFLSRVDAERLLNQMGFAEGLFLIRDKDDTGNRHVLSVVCRQAVVHVLIERKHASEPFRVNNKPFGEYFTIGELVEFIRNLAKFEYPITYPLCGEK